MIGLRKTSLSSLSLPVLIALQCTAGAAAELDDPWQLLGEVRREMSASPQAADFVQEYLPAGFSAGDREKGLLYLAIPECARWDYLEPYPKSFLLCGSEILTWNKGESAGRRFQFSDTEEPGIDLLRLRLDELRQRYRARLEAGTEGSVVVILVPRTEDFALAEARLEVDRSERTLIGVSYSDQLGNESRFEIGDYRDLSDTTVFDPPADLEWMEQ